MRTFPIAIAAALSLGALTTSGRASAQDASVPGTPSAPFPTYNNLSIEWPLSGDDDNDSVVAVRYRKQGDVSWRDALPLLRVPAGSNAGFSWANRHSGSVFGLDSGTSYEIELSLSDADGGSSVQMLTMATRGFPAIPASGNVNVTPATIDAAIANANPGDVLVLADGSYGPLNIGVSGEQGAPIVLMADNTAGAVVQGDVRIDGQTDVQIIGLQVEGKIKFNSAARIVIRACVINTTEDGVVAFANGVENALIVDNTITGATQWAEASLGVSGNNVGDGVVLTGPGNVIAFNRISGFRDCISTLEGAGIAVNQQSIDVYGNDLSVCADDAIEVDYGMGNVRVYRNQIVNAFMGISSQPSLGGPSYFIRNVMYNIVFQAFKLHNGSIGDFGIHNTVIKSGDALSVNTGATISRAWFRNNLFIGGPGATYNGFNSGPGRVIQVPSADASCSFDYDAYGAIGVGTFGGNLGGTSFDSVASMQGMTSEANGFEVDLSVFADTIVFPADAVALRNAPDFALADGGSAVDSGIALANVNDDMTGVAPDVGALERGVAPPIYGPGGTLSGSGGGGTGGGGTGGDGGSTVGAGGSSAGAGGIGGASGGVGAGSGTGGNVGSEEDSGCSCTTVGGGANGSNGAWLLVLAALGLGGGRRSRTRRTSA